MPKPRARSGRRAATATADPAVAELLAAPPEEFTARRDARAKELAAAGDAAGAARVRALRRPTVVVWILDRLARERPDDVAALLEAGERLRQAQARALRGDAGALREASAALDADLRTLLGAAAAIAEGAGRAAGAGVLAKVERGLRAAAIGDPAQREALRSGTLEREPELPGVELIAGLSAVPERRADDREPSARAEPLGSARASHASSPAARTEQRSASARAERASVDRAATERAAARAAADAAVIAAVRALEEAERGVAAARVRLAEARRSRDRLRGRG